MQIVLVVLGLAAGAGIPVQAALNTELRSYLGRPEWSAAVSFGVGLVGLLAFILLLRIPWPAAASAGRAPWWTFAGGLLGAFYVSAVIVLTARLGVATTLALTVAGQTAAALLLDHLGAFDLAVRHVTAGRLVGVVLLVAGVVLVRR